MKVLLVLAVVGLAGIAAQVAAIRFSRRQHSLETYALIREANRREVS